MFHPPFCPHRHCDAHYHRPPGRWWYRCGSYHTRLFGTVSRFRCKLCGGQFSTQSFSIDYYAKRRLSYPRLLGGLCSCSSVRALGRNLRAGRKTIENKIMRLTRQALALQLRGLEQVDLQENLVIDGFESFWASQYFPNNLHVAVGADSQFVYAWNGVTIRRSGRMRESQRRRREELERSFRADPQGVKWSFGSIAWLCSRLIAASSHNGLALVTDEHRSYPPALASLAQWHAVVQSRGATHRCYSSRLPRTVRNPLFAANYIDRELRKDLAEHVRETTRFARAAHTSMERLSLYLVAHNFFKPWRLNGTEEREKTHAVAAGVGIPRVPWWFFTRRAMFSHQVITKPFLRIWLRMYETPLARHGPYLPCYLTG